MSSPLTLAQVQLFLKVRSALRVIVIATFYGAIALGLARWLWDDNPAVQTRWYLALMIVTGLAAIAGGFLLRIARCPRCGNHYAVRADGKARNNFTSQCLNCGLRLDGANAG